MKKEWLVAVFSTLLSSAVFAGDLDDILSDDSVTNCQSTVTINGVTTTSNDCADIPNIDDLPGLDDFPGLDDLPSGDGLDSVDCSISIDQDGNVVTEGDCGDNIDICVSANGNQAGNSCDDDQE